MKDESLAYLWVGDAFLIEEKSKLIRETLKKKISGEIFECTYSLLETPVEAVLTDVRTLPFSAVRQIFRMREAETLKKKDTELLVKYLENPSPVTYLFLEASALNRDHPLVQAMTRYGEVFFLSDQERHAAGNRLIKEKLKSAGKTIAPEAFARLEEQVGDAPAFLDSLLEQLITYAAQEKVITEEMVEAFDENWKELDVFKLTDAMAAQDTGRSLHVLNQLLEKADKDLVSLLGVFHWQLRRYWKARVLLEEGVPENILLKECRISPRQAPYFMRQLNGFGRKKLEQAIEGLFHLDWQLKTGRAETPSAVESWLVRTIAR